MWRNQANDDKVEFRLTGVKERNFDTCRQPTHKDGSRRMTFCRAASRDRISMQHQHWLNCFSRSDQVDTRVIDLCRHSDVLLHVEVVSCLFHSIQGHSRVPIPHVDVKVTYYELLSIAGEKVFKDDCERLNECHRWQLWPEWPKSHSNYANLL